MTQIYHPPTPPVQAPMIDGFGRRIEYVRISVTDRCDLRCRYCMAETMQFLPRAELLTLEEIEQIAARMVARGVGRLRLTGGEPLVRKGIVDLAKRLGQLQAHGLKELTLTTNGVRLGEFASGLFDAGIRRVNVSLDTLDPVAFRHITRVGALDEVLTGIRAARAAGMAVKINMVALKGLNEDQLLPMLDWCAAEGCDLTLIETMPLGEVADDRTEYYLPLHAFIHPLRADRALMPIDRKSGGPARYFSVEGSPVTLGLITPLSDNFCAGCNRMRLTAQGRIYMCLGQDDHVDLRAALREQGPDALDPLLDLALGAKPRAHDFVIAAGQAPAVARHMSVTGG